MLLPGKQLVNKSACRTRCFAQACLDKTGIESFAFQVGYPSLGMDFVQDTKSMGPLDHLEHLEHLIRQ